MKKRILAAVLAVVMLLSVVPFAVSADDNGVTPYARSQCWNKNYSLVVAKLLDNESSEHWKYVAENNKELADTMLTYTVFALYDNAWKNGFDKSVSVDTAEKVLCSLIEKVDAGIGDSYVSKITAVLKTAQSLDELLEKVNSYVKVTDIFDSTEWKTTFKYIGWAIEAGNLYEEARDRVIDAYAQILAVQAANEYYIDFLRYVANNCDYAPVATAASNLIASIEDSIDSLITKEVLKAAGFTASSVLDTAARIAMETNSYTAVALKVYDIGTSVADKLWNTGDQYALMDQLYTTFYAETCAVEYAKADVLNNEKNQFAISAVISLREAGADSLYNLKVAQNGGAIGKIKNQINRNITFGNVAENSFLDAARALLFADTLDGAKEVKAIITSCGAQDLTIGNTVITNDEKVVDTADCYGVSTYSAYSNSYVKVALLYTYDDVLFSSTNACYATAILEKLVDGKVEDWSFTNVTLYRDSTITVPVAFSGNPCYTFSIDDSSVETPMSDNFCYPPENPVNAATVAGALGGLAVAEAESTVASFKDRIKSFMDVIKFVLAYIFSAFKK